MVLSTSYVRGGTNPIDILAEYKKAVKTNEKERAVEREMVQTCPARFQVPGTWVYASNRKK
jgi:hypothetical protein